MLDRGNNEIRNLTLMYRKHILLDSVQFSARTQRDLNANELSLKNLFSRRFCDVMSG